MFEKNLTIIFAHQVKAVNGDDVFILFFCFYTCAAVHSGIVGK